MSARRGPFGMTKKEWDRAVRDSIGRVSKMLEAEDGECTLNASRIRLFADDDRFDNSLFDDIRIHSQVCARCAKAMKEAGLLEIR